MRGRDERLARMGARRGRAGAPAPPGKAQEPAPLGSQPPAPGARPPAHPPGPQAPLSPPHLVARLCDLALQHAHVGGELLHRAPLRVQLRLERRRGALPRAAPRQRLAREVVLPRLDRQLGAPQPLVRRALRLRVLGRHLALRGHDLGRRLAHAHQVLPHFVDDPVQHQLRVLKLGLGGFGWVGFGWVGFGRGRLCGRGWGRGEGWRGWGLGRRVLRRGRGGGRARAPLRPFGRRGRGEGRKAHSGEREASRGGPRSMRVAQGGARARRGAPPGHSP